MEHQTSAEIFEMPENPVQQNVCDIATLDFPFSKWFSQFHINIYIKKHHMMVVFFHLHVLPHKPHPKTCMLTR